MKTTAIILAAGTGKRMNSKTKKQYLEVESKPILYYSLKMFDDSFIDSIVLVTSEEEKEYCRREILEKYNIKKVETIVAGGKERYHSVMNAIFSMNPCDYVFIHDGARPFVSQDMLLRLYDEVKVTKACVAAMPVKDTIKIADEDGFVKSTPKRDLVWTIQTPQVFEYTLIEDAYSKLRKNELELINTGVKITDDAMVVESLKGNKIRLVEGSYQNIKITTQEDLEIAKIFAKKM